MSMKYQRDVIIQLWPRVCVLFHVVTDVKQAEIYMHGASANMERWVRELSMTLQNLRWCIQWVKKCAFNVGWTPL